MGNTGRKEKGEEREKFRALGRGRKWAEGGGKLQSRYLRRYLGDFSFAAM